MKKQDVELIQFKKYGKETLISVNIVLSTDDALNLEDWWFNKVDCCQAPLIDCRKDGLHLHIPWILKKETKK